MARVARTDEVNGRRQIYDVLDLSLGNQKLVV